VLLREKTGLRTLLRSKEDRTACNIVRAISGAICTSETPVPSARLDGVLKQRSPKQTFTSVEASGLMGINLCYFTYKYLALQ
jgi:hypothetical protein